VDALEVISGNARWSVQAGDCLDFLHSLPKDSVDLFFFSPPYEDARVYGRAGALFKGQEWVDWMVQVFLAASPKVKGLIACVCQGRTRKFQWSATPALLMADLHRAGFNLRNPPIFHRNGISGSGSVDWLRSDYEWIVTATRPGRLPWSDNTACGKTPKYREGGEISHRTKSGARVNRVKRQRIENGFEVQSYSHPKIANPGNVLRFSVGGGRMGHDLAHENEAPFPLGLAEFFVKSFCPPDGIVLDCFCGSGTTGHAALLHGRRFLGSDLRDNQVDITKQRLTEVDNGMRSEPKGVAGSFDSGARHPAGTDDEAHTPGGASLC
jgi:site-specific DNA-methyltransferase (adenine-specific)/site-specific DNA-methyltransferase (cytosine-N4-specific)